MNDTGLMLDLGGVINKAVEARLKELNIEEQVKELMGDVVSKAGKVLVVKLKEEDEGQKVTMVHKQFEDLLQVMSVQGINTLLTGGAGLSKSTAVEQAANALNLKLGAISFSNQTTKTDLLGFVDANGVYRKSAFVDAFENGKVFLADEMDACSANVLVLLNSAISNGFIETPDNNLIHAHENFRFVGTANTNLRGSKDGFTARNKLDSATIDRFTVIEWELDEELEEKLTNNNGWLKIVRHCRDIAEKQLEGVVITPRSSYDGAKLLKAGVDVNKVIKMTIIRAMGEDEEKALLKNITENMRAEAVRNAGLKPKRENKKEEKPLKEIDEGDVDDFEW